MALPESQTRQLESLMSAQFERTGPLSRSRSPAPQCLKSPHFSPCPWPCLSEPPGCPRLPNKAFSQTSCCTASHLSSPAPSPLTTCLTYLLDLTREHPLTFVSKTLCDLAPATLSYLAPPSPSPSVQPLYSEDLSCCGPSRKLPSVSCDSFHQPGCKASWLAHAGQWAEASRAGVLGWGPTEFPVIPLGTLGTHKECLSVVTGLKEQTNEGMNEWAGHCMGAIFSS